MHTELLALLNRKCGDGPVMVAGQPAERPADKLAAAARDVALAGDRLERALLTERLRGVSYGRIAARLGWHKTAAVRAVERAKRRHPHLARGL